MGKLIYDRSFYFLNEEIAQQISDRAKEKEKDRIGADIPKDYEFPLPDAAVDSRFLMILMQGYFSSSYVPTEMKTGLLDLYEELVKGNLKEEERQAALVQANRFINISQRIREAVIQGQKEEDKGNIIMPG